MSAIELMKLANKAVRQIEADLSDRRGLSGEWDMIDDETKREIRKEWAKLIAYEFAFA